MTVMTRVCPSSTVQELSSRENCGWQAAGPGRGGGHVKTAKGKGGRARRRQRGGHVKTVKDRGGRG
jgi:hypothetical protein